MIDQKISHPNLGSAQAREQKREEDEKSTVWAFVWTLFFFKIGTVIAIYWAAGGSLEAGKILLATSWFFVLIPAFAIAGPLLYHYRIRKARRRRAAMVRSEWMLD